MLDASTSLDSSSILGTTMQYSYKRVKKESNGSISLRRVTELRTISNRICEAYEHRTEMYALFVGIFAFCGQTMPAMLISLPLRQRFSPFGPFGFQMLRGLDNNVLGG